MVSMYVRSVIYVLVEGGEKDGRGETTAPVNGGAIDRLGRTGKEDHAQFLRQFHGLAAMNKDGHDRHVWQIVADGAGRPLGKYQTPCAAIREEIDVIRRFLSSLQKGQSMSKNPKQAEDSQEKTNMVFLAGVLKFDPKVFDTNVGALIDVGQKQAIQISVYTGKEENKELAATLKRFKQGDFIKVVAMLRPYGVKQEDGSYKNNMSIDVTTIKTPPPRPQGRQAQQNDDDIPF